MSTLHDQPNLVALHGALLIESLVRHGVTRCFLAPGSRSSPLAVAAARHDKLDVTIRIDERGAAFHALGAARGSGQPTVVITTSGTAVANLLPAIVEASMDRVPLIVLTADRPPELHDVGANQAIPQQEIFGAFVRLFLNVPAPEADTYDPRNPLADVAAAVAAATDRHPGPVHINCQLREPLAPTELPWDRGLLEPIASWMDAGAAPTRAPAAAAPMPELAAVAKILGSAERGLLVLGTLRGPQIEAARTLARHLGWAVFADLRSGFRLGSASHGELPLRPYLDRVLDLSGAVAPPDVILQLGGRITSKRIHRLFQRGTHSQHVLIDDGAPKSDPTHGVTQHVLLDVAVAASALVQQCAPHTGERIPSTWETAHALVHKLMEALFTRPAALTEPLVARRLSEWIAPEHALFVSNSMPIRDLQDFAAPTGPQVPLGANRGASGIDGIVSSAIGFAEGHTTPATLLIGDLALLHDLNSLGCLAHAHQPLTIVVVNNGGGGIFAFLPIADHEAVFNPYFETPHTLSFAHIAHTFGLRYFEARTPAELEDGYRTAIAFGERALIEVRSAVRPNRDNHLEIDEVIRATFAPKAP